MKNRHKKKSNKINLLINTEDYLLYLKTKINSNGKQTKSLTKKQSNINLYFNDTKSYPKNDNNKNNTHQSLINNKDLKISQLKKEINSIEKNIIDELKLKKLYSSNTYNPKQNIKHNIILDNKKNTTQILKNFNNTSIFRNFSKKNITDNELNSSRSHYKTDYNENNNKTKPFNQKTYNKNNLHSIFLTKTNINFFKQKKEKKIFHPIYYYYTNNNINIDNNAYSIPLTSKYFNSIENILPSNKNIPQKGKTRNKSSRKNDINFSCPNCNGTFRNKIKTKNLTVNKCSYFSKENSDNGLIAFDQQFVNEKNSDLNFDNIQQKLSTVINSYFNYYEVKNQNKESSKLKSQL